MHNAEAQLPAEARQRFGRSNCSASLHIKSARKLDNRCSLDFKQNTRFRKPGHQDDRICRWLGTERTFKYLAERCNVFLPRKVGHKTDNVS